jgi:MFS family permease
MSVGQNWSPTYERRVVLLLGFAFGLVGLDRQLVAILYPLIAADLHFTYRDLGDLIGILGLSWGVFAILAGNLSDRFGRRSILVPAVVGFSLMAAFSGLASGIVTMLALRALMGVFEGSYSPTSLAVNAEASKPARLGFNQGLQLCAYPLLGFGLGPIIAVLLLRVVPNWRWVFAIVAIPGLVVAALLWMTVKEPRKVEASALRPPSPKVTFGQIFRHRNIPLGIVGLMCSLSGVFVIGAMVPSYLTSYVGLSVQDMGFTASAIGFGGFIGEFVLPWLSDFWGRKRVLLLSYLGSAVFIFLFSRVGRASSGELFFLLSLCSFFSLAATAIISGPLAIESAPRGAFSSVAGLVVGLGEIFGGGGAPVIAGGVAEKYGIGSALTVALVSFIAGFVVSCFLKETAPRLAARR